MASLTVGTTAVQIPVVGRMRPVIQNLGPGTVYIDLTSSVTPENGLKIAPDTAYEVPAMAGGGFWAVSDTADTDVRYMSLGG